MLLPVQRVKQKKKKNVLGLDIKKDWKRFPAFYNFPSASHLKIIFYAFKQIAKYFGNESEFFSFWRQCHKCLDDNTIQYNSIKCKAKQSNAMQSNAMQYNVITFI